jgi:GT2 family glycosyltransferase
MVWIIVLHWRGSDHTKTCLTSLRNLSYGNFKTLLVDNGGPDKDGEAIARNFPEAALLKLEENLGFAGGANAGIDYCLKQGAKWIWLLNNDTKVDIESLSLLMDCAEKNLDAGAVGAMVHTGSGETYAASGRGEIDFRKAKTYLRQDVPQGQAWVECAWISGSNLLMRAEALEQVGAFDERYFLYFEDTDLCHRLRLAGWKCLLVPKAKVEHVGGASTEGALRYWRAYYYTRNRLLFFRQNVGGIKALPAHAAIAGHLLRHALVLPARGDHGRKQLKAEFLGLCDYVNGRLGKAQCLDWCEKD